MHRGKYSGKQKKYPMDKPDDHKNKYEKESQESQKQAKLLNDCGRKRKYKTQEAAYQKNQRSYKCEHCGGWHRSGALGKLVTHIKAMNGTKNYGKYQKHKRKTQNRKTTTPFKEKG